LGFGGLVLVIVVIGIHSIARITELGQSIDVILRENYRSVIACQEMKEALERMDSGALFTVLGHEEQGKDLITKNVPLFEKALQAELNNITLLGEGERAESIRSLFNQYRSTLQTILDPGVKRDVRHETYFSRLLPLFQKIKDTADDILRMNQENMVVADMDARKMALAARQQMYMILFIATLVAGGFIFFIGRWVLQPITHLTRSAREIKEGNLDLMVQSSSRDEIGQLSEAFNEMAASLREFRRSGQTKLFRIQQSMQQAFNNLPDVIAVVNPEGQVEVVTEAAREAFGLKPNVKLYDLPYPWMATLFEEALRGSHRTPSNEEPGIIQQFVRGEERFYRPRAVSILDNEKQSAGIILVLRDVTQQLQQDEMKKGAISTVSHQLKTPLTSIRMAIHLLLEGKIGELTPKQEDLLMAAREDADRLYTILEELLDISRIESGRARMDFHPLSPHSMVLEAVEPFRSAALDRGLTLSVDLPNDLPDVWVDMARITYVFANLLSNALKYTSAGGSVSVSAQAKEESVCFKVSDTGIGIPDQYLPHIFEQFFRAPNQTTETGAGLGLAITKEIVIAHGGTISVESREGVGSTFSFTVKRADRVSKEVTDS
jgi:signal transduction histidine kinase